jgi:hypothetical protein
MVQCADMAQAMGLRFLSKGSLVQIPRGAVALLAVALAGCGLGGSNKSASPTSTPLPTPPPTVTAAPQATKAARPTAGPTSTVAVSANYSGFIHRFCQALKQKDTNTLSSLLPYYQYNSGLRYGMLGDGEGETGDPSLFSTWLQNANVRCDYFTPDVAGHGTVLASGWIIPGPWSLIDMDIFNGAWKINDFTFGNRAALMRAMHTSHPILAYRG